MKKLQAYVEDYPHSRLYQNLYQQWSDTLNYVIPFTFNC